MDRYRQRVQSENLHQVAEQLQAFLSKKCSRRKSRKWAKISKCDRMPGFPTNISPTSGMEISFTPDSSGDANTLQLLL
jgi:hypothetical protein